MRASRVASFPAAPPCRFNSFLPTAYLLCFLCFRLKAQALGKKHECTAPLRTQEAVDLGAGALPGFRPARCLLQSLGAPRGGRC